MVTLLVIVGLLVAAFVGFNIGGSSTGVAFGPAVGSRAVTLAELATPPSEADQGPNLTTGALAAPSTE